MVFSYLSASVYVLKSFFEYRTSETMDFSRIVDPLF